MILIDMQCSSCCTALEINLLRFLAQSCQKLTIFRTLRPQHAEQNNSMCRRQNYS